MTNNFSKCREWVPRGTFQHKWRWLTTLLLILTLGIGNVLADTYADVYANPASGSGLAGNANGKGAFSVITPAGGVSFGNSSLQISSNGGSGTFTVASIDGSYITSIAFTSQSSYPINTLTSEQGTITIDGNVYTFTPSSATLTSATFSMSAKSNKKVRVAPITVNLTSDHSYLSMNFGVSSGTVSCTKSSGAADLVVTTTGSASSNRLSFGSGKTLTFTSEDHNISSINFTFVSHAAGSGITASTGTFAGTSWTPDEDVKTVTFSSSSSNTIGAISVKLAAATPPANYTVTLNPNGGSYAETPDGWTLSEGVYTKSVAAGSFTPPTGLANSTKDLTWKDNHGTDITFPITLAKDSTFVAQWADHAASSDATLSALSVAGCTLNETFDPATEDYTITLPFYGAMPVVGDVTATKNDPNAEDPVVSISGNVISVEVTPESGAGDKKTYTITVNIAAAPTASSSINIEQLVLDHGKSYDIAAAFAAAHIAYDKKGNTDELDSLKNQSGRNEPYLGLKMKKTDASITVVVPASSTLKVKFGNLPSAGIKVTINGVAQANHTSGNFELAAISAIREVVLAAPSTSTIVFKQIMVGENIQSVQLPWLVTYDAGEHGTCATAKETWKGIDLTLPTVTPESGWNFDGWKDDENNDATSPYKPTKDVTLIAQYSAQASPFDLTALTYQIGSAAAVNVGYEDGTFTYNIELPYKPSYDAITVAPTLKVGTSYLKGDEVLTVSSLPGAATFTVVEAGGASEQLYTVNFTKAPKDGTSIIKAVASATAQDITGANLTGAFKGAAHIETASSYKLNEDKYFMVQLVAGQNFQAGDIVKINVSAVNDCNGFTLYSSDEFTAANLIIDTHTNSDAVAKISAGINKVELPSSFLGSNKLYVARAHGADKYLNAGINQVEVTRVLNPQLVSITIDGADGDINEAAKTIELTLPYSSDLAALTVEPTIAWNEAAATNPIVVNDGGAWVLGPNTYKLTDKDGDATTYTITLTKAPHYEAQIGSTKYASLVAAVAAANADETVQLLDNVDLMATGLTIAENITLDLNGFNIKAGEQIDNDIVVPAGKKLTLVDNSANAEGKIYTEQAYTGAVTGYGLVRVAGELLMQSGNIYAVIESDPANLGQFAVVLGAGGKATIEGGQIKAGWYAISNNGNNTGSTIIVSGGELISTADFAIYNPAKESTVTVSGGVVYGAAGGIAMNRGELTVTGGTITSKDQGTTGTWGDGTGGLSNAAISANGKYESVSVEISGGTVTAEGNAIMITNGTTNPVEVAISGGQFSHVVPAEYCAEGFAPVTTPNAQGKYEVEDKRIYIFNGITSSSSMATSPSGAISWAKVGDTMGEASKSGTYDEVNYVKALQLKNSSTTKHFRIDVDINNNAKIEVIGMSNDNSETRRVWLTNSTDKGEIANAIASLATTGYNPEMFATDWLEEGSYYLHADNTVNIFLIRVTSKEVDPKCEVPTITTQPATDLTFGAGNMTATVEAEVSDEGTLTYQWYNAANDEAVVGQTTATLTTADEGTYYVIVTNTKASHRDNSIKSENASLAHRVMNDATLSALSVSAGTLAPAFDPAVENYSVNLAMGTTVVPTLTATATMNGYANVVKNEATEFVNYEAVSTVVVTSEDLSVTKTYTVHFNVAHAVDALVDVTENTTWDWSLVAKDASGADITSNGVTVNENENGLILANYLLGENFDKIKGNNGAYAIRNGSDKKVYQGASLHMHTTVNGTLKITAANEGHSMTLNVQNAGRDMEIATLTGGQVEYTVYVLAGDVRIYNVSSDSKPMRVSKITFTVDATQDPDYTRDIATLNIGNIGTLCVDHNVPVGGMVGATFYQIAGKDEYGKIAFDEVDSLVAGEPYIFQSHTNLLTLYYGNVTADEAVVKNGMHGYLGDANYTLDIDESNKTDIMYIANNRLWNCEDLVGIGLTVVPNRCYIVYSAVSDLDNNSTPNNGRKRVFIGGASAPQTATGLENLVGGEQAQKLMINGQLYILRGEKLFDATGRLVK